MSDHAQQIHKEIFPNGLAVITEPMEHVHSVSVGIWVRSGSRREPPAMNGVSHFIEHMVFKGTRRRSAEDIAREMDSVLEPKFAAEDIEREQSVVLEEIRMTQDNPEDLVHELFTQNFWTPHALGKPILGTPETVSSFTGDSLREWFRRSYAPNNLVITAAGNLTHQQLLDLVSERFAGLARVDDGFADSEPQPTPHVTLRSKKELEQVHICIGLAAFPMTDKRRFAVSVLNNVLGGGMSSRLFQNIRERMGLAYAIFSEVNSYRDAGMLSVYAGTSLETTGQLVRCVLEELRRLRDERLTPDELRRAKDHLKGATLLALEGSGQRMNSLARYHMYFNRHFTPQELIAMLEAVTAEEVQQIAQEFFQSDRLAASVVGSLDGFSLSRANLVI